MNLDPVLSIILLLFTGYVGGLVSSALRLPRVIGMILLGVALAPGLHPSVLNACNSFAGSVSPASTMRTFALLVALARGGLSIPIQELKSEGLRLGSVALLLALAPYFCEAVAEYGAALALLPQESGIVGPSVSSLVTFLAASVWAPLSPSIVIPNMLHMIDSLNLKSTAGLVLTSATLEISVALITYSVLEGAVSARASTNASLGATLGYIPLQIFGSALFGLGLAAAHRTFSWLRARSLAERAFGPVEAAEKLLVFITIFTGAYAVCSDSYIPKLVGLLAVLFVGVGTQVTMPGAAASLGLQLKTLWSFVELTLFPLTGVIVRSAIDEKSPALSPSFFVVLLCGSAARLAACACIGALWQYSAAAAGSQQTSNSGDRCDGGCWRFARGAARRTAFIWAATTPKATLQASLGPRPEQHHAKLGISATAGAFIAQSSALAILYMALIGSVTTYTVGRWCAEPLERKQRAAKGGSGGEGGGGGAQVLQIEAACGFSTGASTSCEYDDGAQRKGVAASGKAGASDADVVAGV